MAYVCMNLKTIVKEARRTVKINKKKMKITDNSISFSANSPYVGVILITLG